MSLPSWAKALYHLDRLAARVHRIEQVLCDEVLFAALPAAQREAFTNYVYAQRTEYLPGGAIYSHGLFDWEKQLFLSSKFPKKGCLLVGAAGGGREVVALRQLGYQVVAFEPAAMLFRGLEHACQGDADVALACASYGDMVAAVQHQRGPLVEVLRDRSFAGIVLGWGSLVHLTQARERTSLLVALRQLAPRAPVVLSFFSRSAAAMAPARSEQFRTWLRQRLSPRGRFASDLAGLSFERHGGFAKAYTDDEIKQLAADTGYEIEIQSPTGFPHALLRPTPQSS